MWKPPLPTCTFLLVTWLLSVYGWNDSPSQYHIQTDEGTDRFFRYQTYNGQYRKERRLDDGTVVGTYGWVDPAGMLRLTDYVADTKGYRVVKSRVRYVGSDAIRAGPPGHTPTVPTPTPTTTTPRPTTKYTPQYDPTYNTVDVGSYYNPTVPTQSPYYPQRYQPVEYDQSNFVGNLGNADFESTSNGFVYRLPWQYHRENTDSYGQRVGSFGYVDPFGIRRIIHYNAGNNGFVHRKDFKYVGHNVPAALYNY